MTTPMPTMRAPRHHRSERRRDLIEYRALVAISFLPCLGVALLRRVGADGPAAQSVVSEALSAARAAAGYALLV